MKVAIVKQVLDVCGPWSSVRWRDTTPEHISLHAVHPHNAPFADVEAQKLIAAAGAPISLDLKYYDECVKRSAEALKAVGR